MRFYREKFKEFKKSLKWTSIELAKAAGLSRHSVAKWENGQRIPSEKAIRRLADILKVNVNEISDLPEARPISKKNLTDIINCDLSH